MCTESHKSSSKLYYTGSPKPHRLITTRTQQICFTRTGYTHPQLPGPLLLLILSIHEIRSCKRKKKSAIHFLTKSNQKAQYPSHDEIHIHNEQANTTPQKTRQKKSKEKKSPNSPTTTNPFSPAHSLNPALSPSNPHLCLSRGVLKCSFSVVPLRGARATNTYRCLPVLGGGPGGL